MSNFRHVKIMAYLLDNYTQQPRIAIVLTIVNTLKYFQDSD